ncbi:12000_t:CDS:2 [Racocetra fulgida]|uniref:12000_t:CDS:1 n=1 Tax=Racocetra fulgida TaxID=60492 RepID=A0A9N9F7G8_9GLOM|nr:12000_t:CDS:2 [Racocetra fulgida]
MDDYRRYRNVKDNSATREDLFSGATNQYGGGYGQQGGYQYPPPGGQYPPPGGYGYGGYNDPYGRQQQETEEDVEEIKSQIRATKIDSLASTQRSLQMINDAEESAQNTLNKLGEQKRINYTERQMDLAGAHAERAAEQAAKLKKVRNPFTKKKREAAELARVQAMQEQQRASREHMRTGNYESQKRINEAIKQSDKASSRGKTPSSNRSRFQFEADEEDENIENQLDNNLDMLSHGLTRLNHMAKAAGDEVRKQNEVLDRISDKTVGLDNRITGTTHTLKKI